MRLKIASLWLLAFVLTLLGYEAVSAQSQPASSYTFQNLTAGVRQVSSSYYVDDFAFSMLNISGGNLTIRARLIADDSNFQFADCDVTGTYTYGPYTFSDVTGVAPNILNVSVMASGDEFTGDLVVESLGGGGYGTGAGFYVFPPNSFTATNSTGQSTVCSAYYNAWQTSSWSVPWFWDSSAEVLISPYANIWHNDLFWDKGWNSSISITNNSAQTINYSVWYLKGGVPSPSVKSQNPSTCSQSSALNQLATPSVNPSATWNSDLLSILNEPSGDVLREDGFFWAYQSPVISGTSPTHSINPNSSGTASNCGDNSCNLLVFECRQ